MKTRHSFCYFWANSAPFKMKKLLLFVFIAGSIVAARADTMTFTPPGHMNLDHGQYYTWGISGVVLPADQVVIEAVLTFTNIDNWANEPNELHSWLLDSAVQDPAHPGYFESAYNPNPWIGDGRIWHHGDTVVGDQFDHWTASDAEPIGLYTDLDSGHSENLVYTFSEVGLVATLDSFIRNGGNFGLGFDPDCHYSYCKATLIITTAPRHVPDGGATLALFGLALLAIPGLKRLLRA